MVSLIILAFLLHVAAAAVKPQFAFFVYSPFFGNNSRVRCNAALNWYRAVTLPSIERASIHLGGDLPVADVHVILFGSESYKSLVYCDEWTVSYTRARPVCVKDKENEDPQAIHAAVREIANRYRYVAFVRIDGDDMLSELSLINIYATLWPRLQDNRTVVVTGTHQLAQVHVADAQPAIKCAIHTVDRATFFSPGLTLGMTLSTWNRYFNATIGFGAHDFVVEQAKQRVGGGDVQVVEHTLSNLAYWLVTPLSSHFNSRSSVVPCSPDYLNQFMAMHDASLLITAVSTNFPHLDHAHIHENTFLA